MAVGLLTRKRQALRLTPAAHDHLRQVRAILAALAQAGLLLRASPTGGALSLALLPAFGMHRLAPRRSGLAGLHPEVTPNLSTGLRPRSTLPPKGSTRHSTSADRNGRAPMACR